MHLLTAYMRIVFAGRRSESPPMQAKRPGLQHQYPLIAQLVPRLPLGWGAQPVVCVQSRCGSLFAWLPAAGFLREGECTCVPRKGRSC